MWGRRAGPAVGSGRLHFQAVPCRVSARPRQQSSRTETAPRLLGRRGGTAHSGTGSRPARPTPTRGRTGRGQSAAAVHVPARRFVDQRGLGCSPGDLSAGRSGGGRDLFDYFFLDKRSLFFVLGDVSDKGVAAATLHGQGAHFVAHLGSSHHRSRRPVALDERSTLPGQPGLHVCDHDLLDCCAPIRGSAPGPGRPRNPILTSPGRAEAWNLRGRPALGLCEGVEFSNHRLQLQPRQSLVFYTDGVSEACDVGSGSIWRRAPAQRAEGSGRAGSRGMVAGLCASLDRFVGEAEPSETISLF